MTNKFTLKKPIFLYVKKPMALGFFIYLQTLFILPIQAINPVVTDSAAYDVFMNLDPSRGLNPSNFATDVSTYLNTMGPTFSTTGPYRINTSAVTLDPTDVTKWEVFDHYDTGWYANQAAWSSSFNNGNIPSNWYYYPVSDSYGGLNSHTTIAALLAGTQTWGTTAVLESHIYPYVVSGKPSMQFYGYSSIGAADFLYYPADASSTKTVKFDVDASYVITHTLISAGFLINCGTTGTGSSKTISGYLLLFTWTPAGSTTTPTGVSSAIYKLSNVNVDDLHNAGTGAPGTLIATSTFATLYNKSHIELSLSSTTVTATIQQLDNTTGNLTGSKSTMFNSQALTTTGFGGFGPFVFYNPHGCTIASAFRYSNLEMSFAGVISGNSSLESYQYAKYLNVINNRFFVNLTNTSATNYAATTNDIDNAYLTRIKNDQVKVITDESTGTYLPGALNQNIEDLTIIPTDADVTAKLPSYSGLTSDKKLAAKVAYLILHAPLGTYNTITAPTAAAVASLYLLDSPGTDAVWTGANQVNEIDSWLVSGSSINIFLNPNNSVNTSGLTATYKLTNPSATVTTLTTSTDSNGKLYFAFPKASATGDYSVTLSYAIGGSITSTVPSTAAFKYNPAPALAGSPVITGTMQLGAMLTVTPNNTDIGITGGTPLLYQWKANGTNISGATASTYTLTTNEVSKTISCSITSSVQSGTLTTTATGTVAAAPANLTSITANYSTLCYGASATLTANGVVGTVYWYTGSCGGTATSPATGNTLTVSPTVTTTYYARNYNNSQFSAGCASILITVNARPTVASLVATGTGIKWYLTSTGGTALATSVQLSNNTHYYASQTVNGAESTARLDVLVTLTNP
ncbi:MAG: hypothetical protein WCG08_05465 [Paludibacter sp.]